MCNGGEQAVLLIFRAIYYWCALCDGKVYLQIGGAEKSLMWLAADNDDRYSAYFIACRKEFGLGTMGEYSLKSHASGKTHQKNISILKENTNILFATSDTPCSSAVMRRDGTEQSAALDPVPSPIQAIDLKGTPIFGLKCSSKSRNIVGLTYYKLSQFLQ